MAQLKSKAAAPAAKPPAKSDSLKKKLELRGLKRVTKK